MSDRGMKKWAPFASLIEQSICLEEMKFAKNKIEKPKISNEIAEKINAILTLYKCKEVTITYYYDVYVYKLKSIIKSISLYTIKIILPSGAIPLSEVLDIEDENFTNNIDFA